MTRSRPRVDRPSPASPAAFGPRTRTQPRNVSSSSESGSAPVPRPAKTSSSVVAAMMPPARVPGTRRGARVVFSGSVSSAASRSGRTEARIPRRSWAAAPSRSAGAATTSGTDPSTRTQSSAPSSASRVPRAMSSTIEGGPPAAETFSERAGESAAAERPLHLGLPQEVQRNDRETDLEDEAGDREVASESEHAEHQRDDPDNDPERP